MLKLKVEYFGHMMQKANSLEKTLMLKKDWRQEKRMTEDKMVGWSPWLSGHEFEQAPEDGEGQESLVCCSPGGHKESDTTEQPNNKNNDRSAETKLVAARKGVRMWEEGKR